MEYHPLTFVYALFCLVFLGCHVQASLPAKDYWLSLWPNTPMPQALRDITQSDSEWRNWRENIRSKPKVDNKKIDVDANYAATNKLAINPIASLNVTFFLEHDLHPGKQVNLEFTKSSEEFKFLPNKVTKSIPFSSSKFSEILSHFKIQPESIDAKILKYTLDVCEIPAIDREEKYCATSMESLVNFTISKLGKKIKLFTTTHDEFFSGKENKWYSVMKGVQKVGEKVVVCHKMNYLYGVFFCHKVASRAYNVPLVANDGTQAKALAVCHIDTIQWSPNNIAFQQLNVKPGSVPICHFIATDSLLWVPN